MSLDITLIAVKLKVLWREQPDKICCTIEHIASQLNMSGRTLQRRLKEEDTSYVALQDRARLDLALKLLESGHSVEEVSDALGFADRRCFTRAFKRWTGDSPRVYRQCEQEKT